ncbi:hypothetical protein I3843_02G047900 [Carya illinoinensis]|nr:hypothetical protein I3843_02G047900 [Carya illinoinensis]
MSSDSDDVDILTSRNFPIEEETVEEQCDVNLGDGDGDGDNVEDGEDGDEVNLISTSSSGLFEPFIGKEFDEVEDAQAFYKVYARKKRFAMRTNHTQLSRGEKKLIGVHYVCTREGFRRESLKQKERKNLELAETKIGCKATMCIKKNGERWIAYKFVPEHNHELLTPRSTSLLSGYRGVTRVQKNPILTLNESGVPIRKIMSVLSKKQDVENYLGNKRRKLFEEGDCKEPGFVYSMQVDENESMGSCFWADARSRSTYQYFGDVVTFDATYLTNVYKMPFVPFSGVNHHHQIIMFGCALLVNETTESYICLLRTWQEAMLERTPLTIIIDDDKAMAKTIAVVLPNTTHRLCLWHILQNFLEHLAHVYNKYPDFQKEFHHCIHDTITLDEFEEEWVSILVKYGLACNDWMQNLYNRREKWILAYLRTTFCAGMSTTQRSESMNKFFKDYVRSSTMVSDFVHQYEKALNARYFKEKEKDVRTKLTKLVLRTCWKIEEEAAKVYIRKSFNIFQEELFNRQQYKMTKVQKDGESKMYEMAPNGKDARIYYVTLDSRQTQAICTCHKFEFLGLLCRHILCVFMKKSNLDMLPHHYVLERWTINAKSRAILEIPNSDGPFPTQEDPILQKSHLMMQFYDVHKELLSTEDIGEQNIEDGAMSRVDSTMIRSQVISNFFQILQDPQRVPTKGRPKSLRSKNPRKTQSVRKRRRGICKVEGHTRNNCPSLGYGTFLSIFF